MRYLVNIHSNRILQNIIEMKHKRKINNKMNKNANKSFLNAHTQISFREKKILQEYNLKTEK